MDGGRPVWTVVLMVMGVSVCSRSAVVSSGLVSLGFRRFVRHVGNGWRVVLGLGAIAIHGAYTSRQRNINQKVEQDLRGKLGLPATGEIYYVQDRPLYQEYENLVLTTYDKWFGYHP